MSINGGIFAHANVFNPDAPPRQRRELRCGDPDIHFFDTSDQVRLRLSRFKGGTKGPVLLSPGFGTSSLAFTIDTVDTNLPEYLYEHGYDVWVFDYRASPALASALTPFTLDDIALRDYPAAVAKIRQESGADTIQAMVHCVGSLTFQMAMSTGLQGVRSAVCSQLTLFSKSPTLNEVKAGLHLANFLSLAGVETVDTSYDTRSDWMDRLYDKLLRLYPTRERCNNPVCRRILFIYGEVYDHDQLNDATPAAIHEMFGPANVAPFRHITRMVNVGHIVDASGNEAYLPYVEGLRIPMAFIHGENNRLFLPEGSQKTYEYLCEKNGPQYYVRQVIPYYAHMDCFIGKHAARDVYPVVLAELEKYN